MSTRLTSSSVARYSAAMRASGCVLVMGLILGGLACGRAASGQGTNPLARLPAGADLVFVVDLPAMQRWMDSSALFESSASTRPAFTAWGKCLLSEGAAKKRLAASVDVSGEDLVIRFVVEGSSLDEVERCGQAAGLKAAMSADRKALELTISDPGAPTVTQLYLAVPGGVFCRMASAGGSELGENTSVRADLERDLAALAQSSAATDPRLAALERKVDASQPLWFVGHAGDLTTKLAAFGGSAALERGLALHLVTVFESASTAEARLAELQELRRRVLESLPSSMSELTRALRDATIERAAEDLRLRVALDTPHLQRTVKELRDAASAEQATRPAAVPERVTTEQIASMIRAMKACADQSTLPKDMYACGCQQDLAMSPTFKPADAKAHCAEYVRLTLAQAKLSEEEQRRAPVVRASPELQAVDSMLLFSFTSPCLIEAIKKRSTEHGMACVCLARELANRMAMIPKVRTNEEVGAAVMQVAEEIAGGNLCPIPSP